MKCPKCGYLGFERVDRCRNCGYEFSLADETSVPELPIRIAAPTIDPLADLAIVDAAALPKPTPPPVPSSSELPLFGFPLAADEPVSSGTSPPHDLWHARVDAERRRSVAVRRATPPAGDVPRRRADQSRSQSLELQLDMPALQAWDEREVPAARAEWPVRDQRADDAGLAARFFAVVVDMAILAAIDAVVIYFTLQICGLALADFDILPKGPLLAFLFVQNGGYLIAFTAGGQTLGKMMTGIKVVSAGAGSPLDLGRATLRTFVWVLLAIPAGLGFLTALTSSDHRGLHDRFAHTRVVRG